jgi:hypothetical protein
MSPRKFNFTRARLEKLTCPPNPEGKHARTYVYDADESGLCLCVTSNGAKTFYLYRKIEGRPERIKLGGFPDISIDDARDAARVRKGKIAQGLNPAEEKRRARAAMTLGELLSYYLDHHAKHHKKSWRDDQEQFERYFGTADATSGISADSPKIGKPVPFPGWRTRRVNTISADDFKSLHTKIGEKHGKYAATPRSRPDSCGAISSNSTARTSWC